MRRVELALLVGLLLLVVSLLPLADRGQAATAVEEGDYWTYSSDVDVEGMSLSGSIKMKVTGTEGSGAAEVYVIVLSGSGELSGSYSGYSVSGSVTYSGMLKRLVSNFSLVSSDLEITMSMTMQGETVDMTMGILQTYSPALDDYIGDTIPAHGATIVSNSDVTTTTTIEMDMLGQHISDSDTYTDYNATQTIQIATTNQTVSVPAGEFDCYKYTLTTDTGGDTMVMTYYYSTKVGNYVKSTGSGDISTGFGDSELKSYSYAGNGTGASSLFSGTNLLIIMIVIVVIVVVVLSVVLMIRKRGGAQMQMMPPPETGAPPPPPPPPPGP